MLLGTADPCYYAAMFKDTGKRIENLWLLYFAADLFALAASYYGVLLLRFHSIWGQKLFHMINQLLGLSKSGDLGETLETFYVISAPRIIILLTATLTLLYSMLYMYSGRRFINKRPVAWNILQANIMALALLFGYFYLTRNVFHPRSFFVTVIFCNVVLCTFFRNIMDSILKWLRAEFGIDRCRALLVGSSRESEAISSTIEWNHPHGIHIVARMVLKQETPFDESLAQMKEMALEYGVDMIIFADRQIPAAQIMQVLQLADDLHVSVKVLSDTMNVLRDQQRNTVDVIHGIPFAHFAASKINERLEYARTLFSKIIAIILFVALLPIMLIIAILIKIISKGPVFFIQERIGVNRKPFRMYKFRTMHNSAEEIQMELEEFNESSTGLFKIKKDPRVTFIGRFIRRFSLDELPQLLNVIKGEMSIVGPRPLPKRDFENYYEEWHYSRHSGMPGLTCLWQVSGRSDLDFHDMCILDVFYLRNRNWIMDFRIALKTIWVVIFAKGAY